MDTTLLTRLKNRLAESLEPDEVSTWFGPLRTVEEDDDRLVLAAPNDHFLNTIEESYRPAVDRAIAGLKGPEFQVLFSLAERDIEADSPSRNPTLNPHYRFETFVVGNSNQFAHAAARAVAESPSHSYNPLFLYGGVGLGKTHLLHAIGHEIVRSHRRLNVLYLAAEQFLNELISSIRHERMPTFRERYRTIDVLLVDDVQFLADKERTQEEFFHTFNTLYEAQKQIILSSDSPPRNMTALEERLRSRFEWGLIADIQPPDLETKIVILRSKAEARGQQLPDDVALFLAQKIRSNVRELEGTLNRVLAFSSLTGKALSVELVKQSLQDILSDADRPIDPSEIVKFVSHHYGLKVSEIKSRSNAKVVAFPRQVAMYLLKQLTDLSYPDIGRMFKDKHHSTVMYSVDKIEGMREEDDEFARRLESMIEHFS